MVQFGWHLWETESGNADPNQGFIRTMSTRRVRKIHLVPIPSVSLCRTVRAIYGSLLIAAESVAIMKYRITLPLLELMKDCRTMSAMIFWRMNILIYGLGLIKDWYVLIRKVEM